MGIPDKNSSFLCPCLSTVVCYKHSKMLGVIKNGSSINNASNVPFKMENGSSRYREKKLP